MTLVLEERKEADAFARLDGVYRSDQNEKPTGEAGNVTGMINIESRIMRLVAKMLLERAPIGREELELLLEENNVEESVAKHARNVISFYLNRPAVI